MFSKTLQFTYPNRWQLHGMTNSREHSTVGKEQRCRTPARIAKHATMTYSLAAWAWMDGWMDGWMDRIDNERDEGKHRQDRGKYFARCCCSETNDEGPNKHCTSTCK